MNSTQKYAVDYDNYKAWFRKVNGTFAFMLERGSLVTVGRIEGDTAYDISFDDGAGAFSMPMRFLRPVGSNDGGAA